MNSNEAGRLSPAAESFRAHLHGFHRSLGHEEQLLLQQLVELARVAAEQGGDVQGFASPAAAWSVDTTADLKALLRLRWFADGEGSEDESTREPAGK